MRSCSRHSSIGSGCSVRTPFRVIANDVMRTWSRGSPSIIVGGVEDHVHILCTLGREESVSVLVRELKRESSKAMKEKSPELRAFYWQAGYGAFSVSPSHVPALKEYIANQEERHRKETFQDEFRRLLAKYGVQYDERYVWD